MFKCKNCGKEFPLVAWLEMATTTYPNYSFSGLPGITNLVVMNTNWSSTTTIKKPCCPYCQQLDLEEVPADKKS